MPKTISQPNRTGNIFNADQSPKSALVPQSTILWLFCCNLRQSQWQHI